jgi:hypothetical protein
VSRLFAVLGLGAVLAALAPGYADDHPPTAKEKPKETLVGGVPLFANWPKGQKPDAVLVLSGQTFGYLQPCGCSRPQTGGLERRAQLISALKAKGWPVAGVDLGDLYPEKVAVRDQGRLKYIATMNALREMGYIAVGVGETELKAGSTACSGRTSPRRSSRRSRWPPTRSGSARSSERQGRRHPPRRPVPGDPGVHPPAGRLDRGGRRGHVPSAWPGWSAPRSRSRPAPRSGTRRSTSARRRTR